MYRINVIFLLLLTYQSMLVSQLHPNLSLTQQGVAMIKAQTYPPLFKATVDDAKQFVEAAMAEGILVPIPKDMAGGYTHEQHKKNYKSMQLAGALFQISSDEKYAVFVKEMLMQYADIYKTLPIHPADRSYSTGKLFWQCLNDANWLVFTAQAYDCIYDFLTPKERNHLESELFRPYADFISIENPQFFNRIHSHSTWGNAAVGMIGLAMSDAELIERALYGLKITELDALAKDNDGGFIYEKGQIKAGFLAQLDYAFSPDGYYTEGPYYQRYAIMPFMMFAQAIENNIPDLKIFEYRDNLLNKAVYALLYQTDSEGAFFPINDAQKGMSIQAPSVISAVNIAYGNKPSNELLDIAAQQGEVVMDQNGFSIAKGIAEGRIQPFNKKSIELKDGPAGDEGALGILRSKGVDSEIAVVFKYTSQGLGHGHFDKLSYSMYDGSIEVMQDYGAARWVNIDQKAGGRYLPENTSWAKQTIAHNALVVDRTTHFNGDYDIATTMHSDPYCFDVSDPNVQMASAKETNAYPGIEMHRTLILFNQSEFYKPILIDLMAAYSDEHHLYELPWQYKEQILSTNFEIIPTTPLQVMGNRHGFQHLYEEATVEMPEDNAKFNWMNKGHFYTLTALTEIDDKAIMARIGANDPNFNLRRDALLIHRRDFVKNTLFLSMVEPHGKYSPVSEIPITPYSQMEGISLIYHNHQYTIFKITSLAGDEWTFSLSNEDPNKLSKHEIVVENETYSWTGPIKMNHKKLNEN